MIAVATHATTVKSPRASRNGFSDLPSSCLFYGRCTSVAPAWRFIRSTTRLWFAVALFTLGASGVHELIEWSTTLVMGPQRGMLKLDPDDPFDTQKDLFNNLVGALLACLIYAFTQALSRRHRVIQPAVHPA